MQFDASESDPTNQDTLTGATCAAVGTVISLSTATPHAGSFGSLLFHEGGDPEHVRSEVHALRT